MTRAIFNPREKSLIRANVLVLGSTAAAILLSHFPRVRPDAWIVVPALLVLVGTADTFRHIIGGRWSFRHLGVLLCLYMDLMATFLVLFFLFYPYCNFGFRNI